MPRELRAGGVGAELRVQRVDVLLVVRDEALLVVGGRIRDRLHLEVRGLREEERHRQLGPVLLHRLPQALHAGVERRAARRRALVGLGERAGVGGRGGRRRRGRGEGRDRRRAARGGDRCDARGGRGGGGADRWRSRCAGRRVVVGAQAHEHEADDRRDDQDADRVRASTRSLLHPAKLRGGGPNVGPWTTTPSRGPTSRTRPRSPTRCGRPTRPSRRGLGTPDRPVPARRRGLGDRGRACSACATRSRVGRRRRSRRS